MVERRGIGCETHLHTVGEVRKIYQNRCRKIAFGLTSCHKCRRRGVVESDSGGGFEPQPTVALGKRITRKVGIANAVPTHRKSQRGITIGGGVAIYKIEILTQRFGRKRHLRQRGALHIGLQSSVAIDNRPSILVPTHGRKKSFATHHVQKVSTCAVSKANHPPRRIGCLHQIGVSKSLNITILHFHTKMCENRVCLVVFVRTKKRAAAEDIHVVSLFGAALSQHHIIPTVFFVDVRAFGVTSAKSDTKMMNFTDFLAGFNVDFANLDVALLPKKIAFVALKIQCWVATSNGKVNYDRLRPFAGGIVGIDIKMPARRENRCHHIKPSVVMSDCGGIYARICPTSLSIVLIVNA